jgi:uncharacterized membrane protein YczE
MEGCGMPLLKPVRRETFWRDMLVIQGGFALFGLAIAMMIQANLGTSSWSVLEVALSRLLAITPGAMTIIVGFAILGLSLALREQAGWGTLANIVCIGLWIDLFLAIIPSVEHRPIVQTAMFAVSIPAMGLASGIYIGVDAGAGPRDSLMLAIHRTTGLSIRLARISIEAAVVAVGWMLGGPVGLGTLAFALLIGPAVQWGFAVCKVPARR